MKCDILLKNVEFDYSYYSKRIQLQCPFCAYCKQRSKTYKTLKSLLFHLAHDHKNDSPYFPFDATYVHQVMNVIALAKQWRILP